MEAREHDQCSREIRLDNSLARPASRLSKERMVRVGTRRIMSDSCCLLFSALGNTSALAHAQKAERQRGARRLRRNLTGRSSRARNEDADRAEWRRERWEWRIGARESSQCSRETRVGSLLRALPRALSNERKVRAGTREVMYHGCCPPFSVTPGDQCVHLQGWRHPRHQIADGPAYASQRRTNPRTPFHPLPCQLHGYLRSSPSRIRPGNGRT